MAKEYLKSYERTAEDAQMSSKYVDEGIHYEIHSQLNPKLMASRSLKPSLQRRRVSARFDCAPMMSEQGT